MKHFPLIIANWKMYPTVADGLVLARMLKKSLEEIDHIEVVLCPPSIMVPEIHEIVSNHKLPHLHLGVQNINQAENGPFTGEISATMAKSFANFVIIGHSERIKWFSETPHETNQKVIAALRHGLTPIVCVGETKPSPNARKQATDKLEIILKDIPVSDYHKLVIAYEPVWAISTGDPKSEDAATGQYVQQVAGALRKIVGQHTRIIYGGSTNADNLAEFLRENDIDGALVGAASVKFNEFLKMCEIASEIK